MFSELEKKWVVLEFARTPSPSAVRRAFLSHFKIRGRATEPYQLIKFIRVRDLFEKSGSIHKQKSTRTKPRRTEAVIQEVKSFLHENPNCSLRKASQQTSPTKTTMWRIIRHDLGFRFYHYTSVQPLTDVHKAQRRRFCQWILQQPSNIVERIVWTDEKFFCLHQKPHRKNDGVWTDENPHNICETNNRNDVKVMIFVAIINGMVPIVHAFLDDEGNLSSVNGVSYLSLLQDIAWPRLRHSATRSTLWWMQDGAPPHCTNAALEFLNDKFRGRVISRRTENPWPAHSPDLNPLDFHFWAAAQNQVYKEKTDSIDSLVRCVTNFAEGYSQETIKKVCKNVMKRATFCLQAGGDHFQHLL
jgi:hypothetical protein